MFLTLNFQTVQQQHQNLILNRSLQTPILSLQREGIIHVQKPHHKLC